MLQRLLGMFGFATGRSKSLDRSSSPPGSLLCIAAARRPAPVERLRLGGKVNPFPRIPGSQDRRRRAEVNVRAALARAARSGARPDPMAWHGERFAAAVLGQPRPEVGQVDRSTFAALVDLEQGRLTAADAREKLL